MLPATRNDSLRLQLSGSDVGGLRFIGAMPGVVVLAAAARNGTGAGSVIASVGALAWQAPGSSTPGPACACPADGVYLLEDGEDSSQWLRVQVYADWLGDSGQMPIYLTDAYNNVGPADVAAANAASGVVTTTEYTLANVGGNPVSAVKLWIDPTAGGAATLTVSSDGANFYDPTSAGDAHALSWSGIAPGGSVNVWVKRTLAAAAAYAPAVLNVLQWQWEGVP